MAGRRSLLMLEQGLCANGLHRQPARGRCVECYRDRVAERDARKRADQKWLREFWAARG